MPRAKTRESPTQLECCVLGLVEADEPCTAYAIRQTLATSRSSYWSASAGTIYPLLERFESRGWVRVSESDWGERTRKSYHLSALGRRKLKAWLTSPVSLDEALFTVDPVRLRVFFIGTVSAAEQREFFRDATQQTRAAIRSHEKNLSEHAPGSTERIIHEGSLMEIQARLDWLLRVRDRLKRDSRRKGPRTTRQS